MANRKYIFEGIILLLLTVGGFLVICLFCNWWTARHSYNINEVESNLYSIKENEQFDLTMIGISHARNFSRRANHKIMEDILQKKVMNLGRGGGLCGLQGQAIYLDFFFSEGNQSEEVLLVASPPLMYGQHLDIVNKALWDEPLRYDFFKYFLKNGGSQKHWQLFYYFRNKLRPSWLKFEKYPFREMTKELKKINPKAIKNGFKLAYPHGLNDTMLFENLQYLIQIIKTCSTQKSKLTLLIPPAAFDKWPGHDVLWKELLKLQKEHNFQLIDHSEIFIDHSTKVAKTDQLHLFYDHHHLNTEGVKLYLREYFP